MKFPISWSKVILVTLLASLAGIADFGKADERAPKKCGLENPRDPGEIQCWNNLPLSECVIGGAGTKWGYCYPNRRDSFGDFTCRCE